jgi:MYXO-CTERM domain-containing protein
MSILLRACKTVATGFALATIVVGCSTSVGESDEELQGRESKIGGRWTPVEAVAPNGVGTYEGLGGEKCSGGLKPGTKALGDQLKEQFPFKTYGGYSCRANTANPKELSIHAIGRALDVMTSGATGDKIANHLVANAKALGVQMIIWNRTIWRVNASGASSKAYGGPNPHTDHVHVEVTKAAAASGPGEATVDPDLGTIGGGTGRDPDLDVGPGPGQDDEFEEDPIQDPQQGEDPNACQRLSPAELCAEAFMFAGIQCGTIRDECGNVANCDQIPMLGCGSGETCGPDNRCIRTGPEECLPRSASELCSEGQAKAGLQCGAIPDGCGGSVNCDQQRGFGCKEGERCAANKCAAKVEPPDPAGPGPASENDADDVSPEAKESDDKEKAAAKAKKSAASAGCSTTPGESSGTGGAGAFLGLAVAVSLARRRRRAS